MLFPVHRYDKQPDSQPREYVRSAPQKFALRKEAVAKTSQLKNAVFARGRSNHHRTYLQHRRSRQSKHPHQALLPLRRNTSQRSKKIACACRLQAQ
eukprot:scaffold108040_cov32-Tisochrysis_lutea.AAC.2